MNNKQLSQEITIFHGRTAPEPGKLVGYGAIIDSLQLPVPLPSILSLISKKRRQYQTSGWRVFTPRHEPQDTLYDHLVFALKYEGINLLFFKKLYELVEKGVVESWVKSEPLGQYSRKIWFLYEWLTQLTIEIPDLKEGNYKMLMDENLQYASSVSKNSSRHRIKNNLPGTVNFCPLIYRTTTLDNYIKENLSEKAGTVIKGVHKDILLRTSAFLLIKDSKASFTIEGENPTPNRAMRWGKALGQAGNKKLTTDELIRLQQIVIENSRFVKLGFRTEGGFVGEHDRSTGEPIPDHISARWQDIETLIDGLIATTEMIDGKVFHPVLSAASIAFGFVFIHPFVDGNGRIHRYIIHHLLSKLNFTPQGIIFPVSAAILEKLEDYRQVLEDFYHPLLDFISWKNKSNNNIEVLNDTIDYYRYFDATEQAEFLFDCVDFTINKIIPEEVKYLHQYDTFKNWLDDKFQMPDKTVALLVRFLEQNQGKISKRARTNEFSALTEAEAQEIETNFALCFEK
ncbi:MAG: Fic family protein [Bacteroidetes bacterium]|nr:Fic family protein [Bacteroidota bacterium]